MKNYQKSRWYALGWRDGYDGTRRTVGRPTTMGDIGKYGAGYCDGEEDRKHREKDRTIAAAAQLRNRS